MTTRSAAAVIAAAVVGAGSRWLLGVSVGQECGLLAANIAGCALIGWASHSQNRDWDRVWLTTGLCGSFTSFSGLAVQLAIGLEAQRWSYISLWGASSLLGCGIGFDLGRSLGRTR